MRLQPSGFVIALLLAVACAESNVPLRGGATLTIQGESTLFVDPGLHRTLTVKYQDEYGPIAGQVAFRLVGDPGGSLVTKSVVSTDAFGLASVELAIGVKGNVAFRVVAEAPDASPADWSVSVATAIPPLDASGLYQMESRFELLSAVPGDLGGILNTFLDMTNDPADPATWLIDKTMDELDLGPLSFLVDGQRPSLDYNINQAILSRAPDILRKLKLVGDKMDQLTRKWGLLSDFTILQNGGIDEGTVFANHVVTGVIFHVDGIEYRETASSLQLGAVQVGGIPVHFEGDNRIVIGDHTLPLDYGRILLFGLNNAVIPSIDPWSHSVADLLSNQIDCWSIGQDVGRDTGIDPVLFELGCRAATKKIGEGIEKQIIAAFGGPTTLTLHGSAMPIDQNADRTVDEMRDGQWEGAIQFKTQPSPLSKPYQKFIATKVNSVW